MRIFIGIKLDDTVHRKIDSFLKPFKKINSPVSLRWVKPENIHITLRFIGEMDTTKFSEMEAVLNERVQGSSIGPLDIELQGCGKFGRNNTLNILWIGVKRNPNLDKLYHTIEDALESIGIANEPRAFKAHITVARNKKNFNVQPFFDIIDELGGQSIARFSTDRFQVFKSDLQPSGPIYTILKEIPLSHADS